MGKYRIGIVGCGGIAHSHIEGYKVVANELGEVVAGCDLNGDTLNSFCDAYGISNRFTSSRDLIESGVVDVITLLTPPSVRGEVIFPAAKRETHLLVEKPFAENLPDAVSFVEAAEGAGVVLAVSQQFRFMPETLTAYEIIQSGAIGDVRFILHEHLQNRTRVGGWRKDEERLEISIFSIHLLDRMRWLVGQPPETVTAVTRYWNPQVSGETFTSLVIQFSGGVIGTMVSNWHSLNIPECRLRIDGTEGSLLVKKESATANQYTMTVHRVGGEIEQKDCSGENVFRCAIGESMKRLLLAADTNTEPPHSGRDNLQTMAIVDAAYLSASQGGTRVDTAEL